MTVTIGFAELSVFFALSVFAALAVSVFFQNRRSAVNRLFALFVLNVIAWLTPGFAGHLFRAALPETLLIQSSIGTFMGPTFFIFSRAVADENFRLKGFEWSLFAISAAVALWHGVTLFEPSLFASFSAQVRYDGYSLKRPGDPPYLAYTLWLAACFLMSYVILWRARAREQDRRTRRMAGHILGACVVGQFSTLLIINVFTLAGLQQLNRYSVIVMVGALCWITWIIMSHRAWTVEYLLERIRNSEEVLSNRNHVIESELEMARLVQQRLLPGDIPRVDGLEVYAVYQPIEKVGGDYYDFLRDGNRLGIIIADVSGHGIASAFLSSIIKMGFHYYNGLDGATLFASLDALVADKGARAMFATAAFCLLDRSALTLTCCRAGHCPPLLFRRGSMGVEEITPGGKALGIGLGIGRFETYTATIGVGDRLFLYTDGIVESRNSGGEFYGDQRLKEYIARGSGLPLRDWCAGLLDDIKRFSGGNPSGDDITFVAVEIIG